jgi:hypothetical protein
MATNPFFNNFNYSGEQNLIEQLVIESIKMYGHDVYYMPRSLVNEDTLFGVDRLSMFNTAAPVEMYIKNVEGFEGEGDFLSRFNLEIRDSMTLTVARKTWEQIRAEKILTETSWNLLLETGDEFLQEDASGNNYTISSSRPLEGDLVYFPLNDKIFEIKFIEHESVFYQTGALQMYDLRCELWEYSNERLDTGYVDIDGIEDTNSTDVLFYEFLLESGDKLLKEDGDSLILEYNLSDASPTSDNDYIEDQATFGGVIDFSESNPFSEQW